jgi:hypothetical protein
MSQPLKSTILAPIWRWTAFKAVLRMGVAATVSEDKGESFGAQIAQMRMV